MALAPSSAAGSTTGSAHAASTCGTCGTTAIPRVPALDIVAEAARGPGTDETQARENPPQVEAQAAKVAG